VFLRLALGERTVLRFAGEAFLASNDPARRRGRVLTPSPCREHRRGEPRRHKLAVSWAATSAVRGSG
jgi:hypothetical protein